MTDLRPPVALSIAGSDSGGGAGIQADLKTFHAFGVFGTTALTAVTVQNTRGVTGVHPVPVETVRAQVAAVAASIREHALAHFVLDPVMVATSGHRLLDRDAERTILDELFPLAALVTPNLDEATLLAGFPVEDEDAMRRAAEALVARGARAALVKGGHLRGGEMTDILFDGAEWHEWRRPRVDTTSTHGTGCTLSAGVAAGLAHGRPLRDAVEDALDYVQRAMLAAPGLGAGHGPLNHMVPGPG